MLWVNLTRVAETGDAHTSRPHVPQLLLNLRSMKQLVHWHVLRDGQLHNGN